MTDAMETKAVHSVIGDSDESKKNSAAPNIKDAMALESIPPPYLSTSSVPKEYERWSTATTLWGSNGISGLVSPNPFPIHVDM